MSTIPLPPSDPELQALALDPHTAVTYTDRGLGVPLLAIHGLPGSGRDFRHVAAHLEGTLRVLRVDMPGFGGSTAIQDRSLRGRALHLLRWADALELERFAVLGHSLGSAVAVALAALAPTRVSHLLQVAPVGLTPHRPYRQTPHPSLIAALAEAPLLGPRWMSRVRAAYLRLGFPASTPDSAMLEALRAVHGTSFRDQRRHVQRVRAPTLVAWCDDDPLVETALVAALAEALPPGPRLRWPEGGHNPQKTHQAELAQAILAFVGPTPGPPPPTS